MYVEAFYGRLTAQHKNSDIKSDITICLHRIKIYQISDLSFLVVTKLPSHVTPDLV